MWCSSFSNILQILITIHKPDAVFFAFEPVGDVVTDISLLVRLYGRMYVLTVKK